ncbi:MAG TPA: hypothetical protein VER96_07065 [Polyangiaceae bacterium]|nr:hypothetical protein [Polyangiaceae bacterium]
MSTIFQVLPTEDRIPSFRSLLERAEIELVALIHERTGITAPVRLTVSLREKRSDQPLPLELDGPAKWPDSAYAWFSVVGAEGGTDAYFEFFDEDDHAIWKDELESEQYVPWADSIRAALRIGHTWRFRRSAGQPVLINLAYGVLAAQLATLCGGFIDSNDSAWDSELLPAWPAPFLESYFEPSATKSEDFASWAERCLEALPDELAALPAQCDP